MGEQRVPEIPEVRADRYIPYVAPSPPRSPLGAVLADACAWFEDADFHSGADALHEKLQTWVAQVSEHAASPEGGRAAVQKSLRIALTGSRAGPPVGGIAVLLGKAETLRRIRAALTYDEGAGASL